MPTVTESTMESAMGSTTITTTSEVDHERIVIDEFTTRSIVPYENGGMPRHYFLAHTFSSRDEDPHFSSVGPEEPIVYGKITEDRCHHYFSPERSLPAATFGCR